MAAQVLPPGQSHFDQYMHSLGPTMFTNLQGYHSANPEGFLPGYRGPASQRPFILPSQSSSPEESFRTRSSFSPSLQARAVPRTDRTPIQHHRGETSRARSRSRSEFLLSYATEQSHYPQHLSQASIAVVPSESAPTTPQVFPMQSYPGDPGAASFTSAGDYFPPVSPPRQQQLPEFAFQSDAQAHDYYHLTASTSGSSSAGVSGLNPQESIFFSRPGSPPTQALPTGQPFPVPAPLESSPGDLEIVASRPKPQCWDHGCNGRQFSTFSNLLRHQREKSGSAMKAVCPYCGTEFTRTTARNGHMYGGKCKGRPEKEGSASSSTSGSDKPV